MVMPTKCTVLRAESVVVIAIPPIHSIPTGPGSYQFADAEGRILYVGKAKNLRSRVGSYFAKSSPLTERTRSMLQNAASLDWVEVDTEAEAFFLEYNLIKKHAPRYNIRLKDDKSYPWLSINLGDPWPRPMVMRGAKRANVRYFGPYAHAYAIRETLDLLLRTFPVRTCTDAKFRRHARDGRPCLLAHIDKCSAPCVGAIEHAEYMKLLESMMEFLAGNHDQILQTLEREMQAAADAHAFETAARIRDRLEAVHRVSQRQEMVGDPKLAFNVVAVHADDLEAQVQVLLIRRGRVVGNDGFGLERGLDSSNDDLFARALAEMVNRTGPPPALLLTNSGVSDIAAHADAMTLARGSRVSVVVPARGTRRRLTELAARNAEERLRRGKMRRASDPNTRAQALRSLQDALQLRRAPLRIECFDISHLGGTEIVASMVVMEDALLKRSEYRRFRIKGLENQDDFASMEQVVSRRLSHLTENGNRSKSFRYAPDLLVIDGGLGQIHAAMNAIREHQADVEVVSIAKRLEALYRPNLAEPIQLERNHPALYLLQQVRDEAHRFAITFQRQGRTQKATASLLDEVPGLGPKRKARLLREFGSVRALRSQGLEALLNISWLPESTTRALFDTLHARVGR
jgi:excinuclease ABC subunit C